MRVHSLLWWLGGCELNHLPCRPQATGINKTVTSFKNLGKDSGLIVPCPDAARENGTFTHIKNFVRDASKGQLLSYFKLLGAEADLFIQENGNAPR